MEWMHLDALAGVLVIFICGFILGYIACKESSKYAKEQVTVDRRQRQRGDARQYLANRITKRLRAAAELNIKVKMYVLNRGVIVGRPEHHILVSC